MNTRSLNPAGLCLAALTAPAVSLTALFVAAFATTFGDIEPQGAPGILVTGLILFLWAVTIAMAAGVVGAGLILAPHFLLAERLARRGALTRGTAILLCGALAGVIYDLLAWTVSLSDAQPVRIVSYVTGTWAWTAILSGEGNDVATRVVAVIAPVLGGLAAGAVYERVTRAPPKRLTTPDAGAI